jgi:hypothetical protein
MSTYHSDSTDIKSLIGGPYHADYIWQESERELAQLVAENDVRQSDEWASQLEPTEREATLEQLAFEREQERRGMIKLDGRSRIFVNRDCNHSDCRSSRCRHEVRLGGIAI